MKAAIAVESEDVFAIDTAKIQRFENRDEQERLSSAEQLVCLTKVNTRFVGKGWRKTFLEVMAKTGVATIAANVAGISRVAAYQHRNDDEKFAADWDDALEQAVDLVEAGAFKSATYGDVEDVYHQGIKCGERVKYSDRMREMILRGRRAPIYGAKAQIEIKGGVGAPLTPEERNEIVEEGLRRIGGYQFAALDKCKVIEA